MKPVLQFQARHAHTKADLTQLIREKESTVGQCVVADLSLGSWTPNALATQILRQVTQTDLTIKRRAAAALTDIGEAMSAGIDQEGRGNRTVLDAVGTARQIVRTLAQKPSAVVILVPAYGAQWRVEDRLLLEYVRSLRPSLDLTLAITGVDTAAWPEDWDVTIVGDPSHPAERCDSGLVSRLPTAFSPALLAKLADEDPGVWIRLASGWAIVAPELRVRPDAARFHAADLAKVKGTPGLQEFTAYAARHSDGPNDPWVFCIEAWNQFGGGYRDLALDYIALAEAYAPDAATKATLTCHKQSMRIAMAQYAEAGSENDPPADLPNAVIGQLMQTKGWGLVMSGGGQLALPYLRQALELCRPAVVDTPYLFLMNITALAEVRCGNFDRALELEVDIERLIASQKITNARLVFVNSINLARLHRYSGDLDGAERLYRRAFSTVDGARTEIDSINANLCLARVEEGRNDAREAFLCWLRAAFCWVANDCPEALNWRVQNLVLGKGGLIAVKSMSEGFGLVETLSASFLSNLQKQSDACGFQIDLHAVSGKPGRFENIATTTSQPTVNRYVGGDGWGVMAGTAGGEAREYGPKYRELCIWLHAWVAQSAGHEGENCYWIDRRDGADMPATWSHFLNSAVDLHVTRMKYNGEEVDLTEGQLDSLRQTREANLNPVVASTEQTSGKITVAFKRYYPSYALSADEAQVFSALQSHPNVAAATDLLVQSGVAAKDIDTVIARLRNIRVIQLSTPAQPAAV